MSKENGQFQNRPENINRKGRPPLSKEIKAIKEYSTQEILLTFSKIVSMKVFEAKEWIENSSCTLVEYAIIKNMLIGRFEPVIDRILGKCPETVNLNTADDVEIIDTTGMSEEEIKKIYYECLQKITVKRF